MSFVLNQPDFARALLLVSLLAAEACYYTDRTEEILSSSGSSPAQGDAGGAGTPGQHAAIISAFSANQSSVRAGYPSTLMWSAAQSSCTLDNGFGQVGYDGDRQVNPNVTTSYTLTCMNSSGTDSKSVTVTVSSPAMVCTPNTDQSCTCSSGSHGHQTCSSDGSAWGACCAATCPC